MKQQPVTLADAKERFRKYTRRVLSNDARDAMRISMEWREGKDGKPPVLILGGVYKLSFVRDGYDQMVVATSDRHFATED